MARDPACLALLGALLLGGCAPRIADPGIGVDSVMATPSAVRIGATLNEPAGDLDLPVAAGLDVAVIGSRIKAGATDMPKDARTAIFAFDAIAIDSLGRQHPTPWAKLSVPVDVLREARFSHLDLQASLDLANDVQFASPKARGTALAYCRDRMRLAINPRFCHLVASGAFLDSGS